MNFKYYDILSQALIGYLTLVVLSSILGFAYNNDYSIPYLAGGFVVGYFINALGSLLESFYFFTIGGMPSIKLLQVNSQKKYSGISKVRFYQAPKAIDMLKNDIGKNNPHEQEMFAVAMRVSNNKSKTRVPEFNAQYAFSRTILTSVLIISIFIIYNFYNDPIAYLISILLLLLSWNRYRERAYYYAREVLNDYLHQKESI